MCRRGKPSQWFVPIPCLVCLVVLAVGVSAGAAGQGESKQAALSCAEAKTVTAEVTPEAEVVAFGCFFKDYKEANSLHFEVKLKNVSDAPQRYRVNIFLDGGKGVGGLIPDKGKPPVVNPGEEASFTYPVKGMAEKAGDVTVLVKTISP